MCRRLHQTPTGEGIFDQDPHDMRRLELVFSIMDSIEADAMGQPPDGA